MIKRYLLVLPLIFILSLALGAQSNFFWESPEAFSGINGTFPITASGDNLDIVLWQQSTTHAVGGSIYIYLAVKAEDGNWERRGIIGGPYNFSGTEPSILSAVIDSKNRIIVAAAASSTETEILISDDKGFTFESYRLDNFGETLLSPRLAVRADGGFLLFITRGGDISLSIFYALSDDALSWSPFLPFITDPGMNLNFLPSHASFGSSDYVIFQSFLSTVETIPAFQLYVKISHDNGVTWTPSQRFTNFRDSFIEINAAPEFFDNQRAHLSVQGDSLFVTWERRFRTSSPQVYAARMNEEGRISGIAERINSQEAFCNNPIAFTHDSILSIIWFDNRRGQNRIFMAQHEPGIGWTDRDLSGIIPGDSAFGRPVMGSDGLNIFWQTTNQNISWIYALLPDISVDAPLLSAQNFLPGRRTRSERAQISWTVPFDSSGIAGFSYTWSMDENTVPDQVIRILNQGDFSSSNIEALATEDGIWYFTIIANDHAGNWSHPSRITFIHDTIPPPAAVMIQPPLDDNGYLLSNTISLRWNPPPASDIVGYSWNLEYLGSSFPYWGMDNTVFQTEASARNPAQRMSAPQLHGTETSAHYRNIDDGLWVFTVQAVDEAGNIGPLSSLYFRTNKYIPSTYITWAQTSMDEHGRMQLRIQGRGFSQNGNLDRITLEKADDPSWRRDFYFENGDFRIISDRELEVLNIDNIEEGHYRVSLYHPIRGIYTHANLLYFDESGTLKYGDFSYAWQPNWTLRPQRRFIFNTASIVLIALFVFGILGIIISLRGIAETVSESISLRHDAAALITGDYMPSERKKRTQQIRRRGFGLRLKLASFTAILIIAVVTMVSAPLYIMMTRTQQETLLRGLWDRSSVLLEGLAYNARTFLPLWDTLELSLLPDQMRSIPEARYVTITGFSPDTIHDNHVWATNDENILSKIDTRTFVPGTSRIEDHISPAIRDLNENLNTQARNRIGGLSQQIIRSSQEARDLALTPGVQNDDPRLIQIQNILRNQEMALNQVLFDLGQQIYSEPDFSLESLSPDITEYTFFKPVMFRQGAEDVYVRGFVRLEVSISSIMEEIDAARLSILQIILGFAVVAMIIGTMGALILSTLIIRPIRQLVRHVEQIRDTENKADLEGVKINIKTQDEIEVLGKTINEMTIGLVKAALAASDLSIGKEIQKKFIPLDFDKKGNKITSGFKDTKNASFFGYYEGAKGVSGDYFDYRDLDGRYYAIIKCDVAGKGIPAALIMIQVATMFINFFRRWKPTQKGMLIEDLVYQINDFIENLGFEGRFAAFTLCLFDSQTGIARFCNAGDNIVHLYSSSENRLKAITLPDTPATGVLPNSLVVSRGGYKTQSITIGRGDILMLYTDGIEEAKRKFRNADFKEILCKHGEKDKPHENHSSGQGDEELGSDRVKAIVNAVMNKQVYTLHKWHNPEGDKNDLVFDFSNCKGNEEDVIMAMVSVEKMFRCYKDKNTSVDDRVLVDKKIDAFLKEHFLQYRTYCSFIREIPGDSAYLYYTHLKEDEKYDDLTILGIKRK